MERWTEDMTARDRIEAVALTLGQPQSVNWIKQQAEVGSWETTKSHLDHLVEMGALTTVDTNGDSRYVPDPMRAYLDNIRDLVAKNTKDELRDELEAIATEIDDWKREYSVDSLEELDASLGDGELSPEEVRDRRRVISYWEENQQYQRLFTHALQLYDDLTVHAQTIPETAANRAD